MRKPGPELDTLHVVLLAGGASSRFYPLDKIFTDLTDSGRTMLQQAVDRVTTERPEGEELARFLSHDRVCVVTGAASAARVRAQLPELPAACLLVEPEARSTLPAILWAAAHLALRDPDAVVAVLTADHLISGLAELRRCLAHAHELARERPAMVTLGVSASDRPEDWTGLGALRSGAALPEAGEAHELSSFEEKPSRERAAALIEEGGWCWNSGMFVFSLRTLETVLAELRPDMAETYRAMVLALASGDGEEAARAFRYLPRRLPHPLEASREVDSSIDYALMMPLTRTRRAGAHALLLRATFSWTDLGSWDSLREVLPGDEHGNRVLGEVRTEDVEDSILVAAQGRRLEARGIRGTIVVHGADGRVLLAASDRAQEVRRVAERAAGEPESQGIFLDCESCLSEPGRGRIALLGVKGLRVALEGDALRVGPLDGVSEGIPPREAVIDALAGRPLSLRPVLKSYPWGGSALSSHLGLRPEKGAGPPGEAWLNSTLSRAAAPLVQAPISLAELLEARSGLLGPVVSSLHGKDLPVFCKILSTRFPPRVRLGLSTPVTRRELLSWLLREQELLRSLLGALDLADETSFHRFGELWESWSIEAADSSWSHVDTGAGGLLLTRLPTHLKAGVSPRAVAEIIESIRSNRARLVAPLNRVDFGDEAGNLLLAPAGTLHGISGMSLQVHPADPGRALLREALECLEREGGQWRPGQLEGLAAELATLREGAEGLAKEEAWIPFRSGGETLILEVQQSSETTLSLADFFTPFTWADGRPVFRKGHPETGLGERELSRNLDAVDLTPRSVESLRCFPRRLPDPPRSEGVRVECLVSDPGISPYFRIHRLGLVGSAERPARWGFEDRLRGFVHVIPVRGAAELRDGAGRSFLLAPGAPAFLPAGTGGGFSVVSGESTELVLVAPATGGGW